MAEANASNKDLFIINMPNLKTSRDLNIQAMTAAGDMFAGNVSGGPDQPSSINTKNTMEKIWGLK